MIARTADATWSGDLKTGGGTLKLGSGAFEGPYTFASRFEGTKQANPEELVGAAHAGCYTMALAHALAQAGHVATRVDTTATVSLEKGETGFAISRIVLRTEAQVPGLSAAEFQKHAAATMTACIVSRALASVPMSLEAKLL